MAEEESANATIVEESNQLMVSLFDDTKPILREAHFLKPTLKPAIDEPLTKPPSSFSNHSLPSTFEPKKWPINLFKGWRYPSPDWVNWVEYLRPKFESLWKDAGIFDAIICSTIGSETDYDLILGFAEKWCIDTNTIVFPWAEATITLEDVMILGCYSVSGFPVPSSVTQDLEEIEQKLKDAAIEIRKGPAGKASMAPWVRKFKKSGSEIEHEAFLTYWIARFVFPVSRRVIRCCLFPIAIYLARGRQIVLGPAVLASIYKDLRVLKETITKFENDGNGIGEVKIWSPLCLIQMWAFERFPELCANNPNVIKPGDPRAALWKNVKMRRVENIRMVLNSAEETFRWRPYATATMNWQLPTFYREKVEWVDIDSESDYVFCLRPSELVGLGYIEQYLPHRVAMQFGLDQDIPGHVARCNEDTEIAWKNYASSRNETRLYLPSRFFDADVTIRYLKWWKQSVSINDVIIDDRNSKRTPWALNPIMTVEENNSTVPRVYPPKCNMVVFEGFTMEKKQKMCSLAETIDRDQENDPARFPSQVERPCFAPNCISVMEKHSTLQKEDYDVSSSSSKHDNITQKAKCSAGEAEAKFADNNAKAPPGFAPICDGKMVLDFASATSSLYGKSGSLVNGEVNNCRVSVDSTKYITQLLEESSGAELVRSARAEVNSHESGVGSSVAVGSNIDSKHYVSFNTILQRKQSQVSWTNVWNIPPANARFANGENTNGCSEKLQMEARIGKLEEELAQLKLEYYCRFGNISEIETSRKKENSR